MDKPSHWVQFFNYIFNPTFGFVRILPKIGSKQPSIFRVYISLSHVITNKYSINCSLMQISNHPITGKQFNAFMHVDKVKTDALPNFKLDIRMGKKGDLRDFGKVFVG